MQHCALASIKRKNRCSKNHKTSISSFKNLKKGIKKTGHFLSDQSLFLKTAARTMISWILLSVKKKTSIKFIKRRLTLPACPKKYEDIRKPTETRPEIMYGSCKLHKNVLMSVRLSDQFYLLYKHQYTSLQSS